MNAAATQLDRINRNLALAETEEQFRAVSGVQKEALKLEVAQREQSQAQVGDPQAEVDAAMALLGRLVDLASDATDYGSLTQLFQRVNANLFRRFQPVRLKKRVQNQLCGGVVTFGSAEFPIQPYQGPTGRNQIKAPAAGDAAGAGECPIPNFSVEPVRGEGSLGNVGRGERGRIDNPSYFRDPVGRIVHPSGRAGTDGQSVLRSPRLASREGP